MPRNYSGTILRIELDFGVLYLVLSSFCFSRIPVALVHLICGVVTQYTAVFVLQNRTVGLKMNLVKRLSLIPSRQIKMKVNQTNPKPELLYLSVLFLLVLAQSYVVSLEFITGTFFGFPPPYA